MGKGDKKTRKGKIAMGSFGTTRRKKKKVASIASGKAPAKKAKK